jgi:hypothetical protein
LTISFIEYTLSTPSTQHVLFLASDISGSDLGLSPPASLPQPSPGGVGTILPFNAWPKTLQDGFEAAFAPYHSQTSTDRGVNPVLEVIVAKAEIELGREGGS